MQEHGDAGQSNRSAELSRIDGTAGPQGGPLEPGLHELCAASAPEVFAICEVGDPWDGSVTDGSGADSDQAGGAGRPARILAWGLDFGADAMLTSCDGRTLARLSAPVQAPPRLYRHLDTRLVRFRTA